MHWNSGIRNLRLSFVKHSGMGAAEQHMDAAPAAWRCTTGNLLAAPMVSAVRACRAQLDNFADGSTSVGCLSSRGNVDGNPDLREVDEPYPALPATCTMRQFRQRVPKPVQPPGGHQLIFHSLSGCWVDPAQARSVPSLCCILMYA